MLHPTIEHEVCSFDLVQATDALLGIRSKLAWELSKPKGTHNAERVAALVDQLSPATLHLEDVAWRLGRRRGREETTAGRPMAAGLVELLGAQTPSKAVR